MEKINIIIPVKSSTRFPGKNRLLAGHTLEWLGQELNGVDYKLFVVGNPEELEMIPYGATVINTPCISQRDDLLACMKDDGIYVELQLTQPFRRKGLLADAVDTFINGDKKKPVISAAYSQDMAWRELDGNGCWKPKPQGDCRKLYYDGAIYVFDKNTLDMIFEREQPHLVVVNGGQVVDVDYCTDMPIDITKKIKDCIIIGSGSDLNGRRLGAKIDNGDFGKVFRINKFYGNKQDVGSHTDYVVTLSGTVWKESAEKNNVTYNESAICIPYVQGGILQATRITTGLTYPTTGIQAVCWALNNGYHPTLIGYGFKNGERFTKLKTYPDGTIEDTHHHNFEKENQILKSWHRQGKLTLL